MLPSKPRIVEIFWLEIFYSKNFTSIKYVMMPLRDDHPVILLSAELYLNSSEKVQNCFFDHYTHFIRDDMGIYRYCTHDAIYELST